MRFYASFRFDFFGDCPESGFCSFLCCHHVKIVQESKKPFIGLQFASCRNQRLMLSKCIKGWHERIALFASFGLLNHMLLARCVAPEKTRSRAVERRHQGQKLLQLGVSVQLLHETSALNVVEGADAVQTDNH